MCKTVQQYPPCRARNDELYPLVVVGSVSALEEMILANVAWLVTRKVKRYTRLHGAHHLADEMESHAAFAIVRAVYGLVGSAAKEPNVTGYLSHCIRSAIKEVVAQQTNNGMSARTVGRRLKKGQRLPKAQHLDDAPHEPNELADLKDQIIAACRDDIDQEIVDLRRQGFTDQETGEQTGISKSAVYLRRQQIKKRFEGKGK